MRIFNFLTRDQTKFERQLSNYLLLKSMLKLASFQQDFLLKTGMFIALDVFAEFLLQKIK